MFLTLDFQATSNRSPSRGTQPTTVSMATFAIIRVTTDLRCAEAGRLKNEVSGEDRAHRVAQTWHQPDEGVEAKPVSGSRHREGVVEQPAQGAEPLQLRRLVGAHHWSGRT